MLAIALQSGSNGNCLYVEAAGLRLLFDAGISGRKAEQRLAAFGRAIGGVDALLLSHDHHDHVSSAGVFQRKFGVPIYATSGTFAAARRNGIGPVHDVRCFEPGERLDLGGLSIQTVPTPHDGQDGVAFVLDDGACRLGILTDLGHVFDGLGQVIETLDGVFLESNYDPQMLAVGPYPPFLKRRIAGPGGHLSNLEAAELLAASGRRLRWACLAHLSEQNNRPDVALQTHRTVLGKRLPLHVADRYGPSGPLEL